MKETVGARDEQKREDESPMCAFLNIHISPSKSDLVRIDVRIAISGAVGESRL